MSSSTLNRMRVTGDGPLYSKLGRRVIYDVGDLDAWIEARKRRFTGESARAWPRHRGNDPSYPAMSMMAATDRPIRSAAASISRSPRWA